MRDREVKGKRKKEEGRVKRTGRMVFLILSFILIPSAFVLVFWWFRGWNGRDPVNVVVSSGHELWVLAVRPEEQRLVEIRVPENMILDVAGHGKWRASALWRLSELENDPRIVESIGWDFLEVPIDGLIRIDAWGEEWSSRSLSTILSQSRSINIMCFLHIKFCEQHEWALPEVIRLLNVQRSLADNRSISIALQDEVPARRVIDPGGVESSELDPSILSQQILEWFGIAEFRTSKLTVAVRNISGEAGGAAKIARLLEHSGLRIVGIGNGKGEKSIMVVRDKDTKDPIIRRLSRWFDLPVMRVGEFEERADVVIVI